MRYYWIKSRFFNRPILILEQLKNYFFCWLLLSLLRDAVIRYILTAALNVIVFANIVICMIVVMGGDDMRGAAMGGSWWTLLRCQGQL